uniref:Uncharacterized protein n=1 Tax=Pseudomonas phage Touem01 TaxID=3138548 RepID=A0AAU6W2V3_9VIRU
MSHPQPKRPTAAELIEAHSKAAYIVATSHRGVVRADREGFDHGQARQIMVNQYR